MADFYLLRTVGGPHPGDRTLPLDWEHPDGKKGWPLPDTLPVDDSGYYKKVAESNLPDDSFDMVARGAQYEWVDTAGPPV